MSAIETTMLVWHDFFLASAGAAAVLLGLTFVGLTIHVEQRGLDNQRRSLAIGSATSLVYTLFTSLLMLEPQGAPYVQAVGLALIGLFGLLSSQAALALARRGHMSRTVLAFQFVLPYAAIGLLLLAAVGLGLAFEPAVWSAGAIVFLLTAAGTQNAWDLLVRFAPPGRDSR